MWAPPWAARCGPSRSPDLPLVTAQQGRLSPGNEPSEGSPWPSAGESGGVGDPSGRPGLCLCGSLTQSLRLAPGDNTLDFSPPASAPCATAHPSPGERWPEAEPQDPAAPARSRQVAGTEKDPAVPVLWPQEDTPTSLVRADAFSVTSSLRCRSLPPVKTRAQVQPPPRAL